MRVMRRSQGFSLIELVIVVVIIGVLGAIAIPRLSRGSEGARINAFIAELNTFAKAIDHYQVETGKKVTDSSSGDFPSELKNYLREGSWEGATPIGGLWDIEANDAGAIALGVGVHFMRDAVDREALLEVDAAIDDGNLKTGAFQQIESDRFYLILEN